MELILVQHHLKSMGYVGLTERFDESLKLMKYFFGFKDLRYLKRKRRRKIRKNTNAHISYDKTKVGVKKPLELDPALREKIKEKNKMDLELYEIAKEMFEEEMEKLSKYLLHQEMGSKL